eukprot:1155727-Pelagomonas_calceolata.AAC.4
MRQAEIAGAAFGPSALVASITKAASSECRWQRRVVRIPGCIGIGKGQRKAFRSVKGGQPFNHPFPLEGWYCSGTK